MSQGLFVSLYEAGRPFALLDTRERRDFVNGQWFGSTNIPLSVLSRRIPRLLPDRSMPIHLLDWQDVASAAAANRLSQLGYNNVSRCVTSDPGTFGQGFVKGEYVWSKAFGEVVAHTAGLPEVTPADYLDRYENARLFDVRPTAEYRLFTIPGSASLPNSLLLANMAALKQSGDMALLHCAGRTRSIIGACTLKAAGYDGPYAIFKGGTQAWQLDGLEREFDAERVFARESTDTGPAQDFLGKWGISAQQLDMAELASFVSEHRGEYLFDVSDDAATGQLAEQDIVKISGTNLIQQTDCSIAGYHVPVNLFDLGSGSRAAFAAYWLRCMGFTVRVLYLPEQLASKPALDNGEDGVESGYAVLNPTQLIKHLSGAGQVIDCRPSSDYAEAHLKGSRWGNISELLNAGEPTANAVALVGESLAQASETAAILQQQGWQVAGIHAWQSGAFESGQLVSSPVESPVDECALFAGRHHGNMQDSRDYLAWEEELPEQIDQVLHQRWLRLLKAPADT